MSDQNDPTELPETPGGDHALLDPVAGRRGKVAPGLVFGRTTTVEAVDATKRGVRWLCQCECGGEHVALATRLLSGRTSSCGCLQRELRNARRAQFNRYRSNPNRQRKPGEDRWAAEAAKARRELDDAAAVRAGYLPRRYDEPRALSIDVYDDDSFF
jgi:hypothetical protein